jgi:hypothetical protein
LACFHEDAELYWEPAVSRRPLVRSRAALEAWLSRLRHERPRLGATLTDIQEHGNGVVCELIVTEDADAPADVWRVALGACFADDRIRQVRAFWSREAAVDWVVGLK